MKKNIIKFLTKPLNYFGKIDVCIYIILIFCVLGFLRNFFALKYFDFNFAYYNTKLFFAMFMIYLAQICLILLRQRIVFLISLIQIFFCFFVYRDFTFLPIANIIISIKNVFAGDISYGWEYFISFTLTSLLVSLEIIKTYLLYVLTDQLPSKKKKEKELAAPAGKSA